jgi:GNAT superfamily N-acetyltransferase
MSELTVTPLSGTDAELAALAELFRVVWPNQRHLDHTYLDWLYRQNPAGPAIGANAWHEDAVVGHYAVIPLTACLRGHRVTGALSLNTAVHPSLQGQGLFTRLAEQSYRDAAERGIDHVIGVANANSTPGFVRRLGFQFVGALDAKISVTTPQLHPASATETPADWARVWSEADYAWRLTNPHGRYRWTPIHGGVAWWADTARFGIRALMDEVYAAPYRDLVVTKLTRAKFTPLKLYIGLQPGRVDASMHGVEVPRPFRSSPLNLIFRSLQDSAARIQKECVRISLLDFDAY